MKSGLQTSSLFYMRAALYLRAKGPKILITRSHRFLPYIFKLKRKDQVVLFETHDFFMDLEKRDDILKSKRLKKSKIEQKYFPRLESLICLNSHQKELYHSYLGKVPDIVCFPTGLTKVERHDKSVSDKIVYVGSLNKRLGIERIVKLSLKMPEYEFVIVGGKTKQAIEDFKRLFSGGELPKNVRITGWIGKSQLGKILEEASIGLLPLTDTFFNRYLTVPLKMFDYFSYGLITIAPDYPSCQSFIDKDKTGFLVDWNELKQVEEMLRKLLSDKKKMQEISKNVFSVAEKMTWGKRAKDQIDYFKKL